jgi:hypothetical protein
MTSALPSQLLSKLNWKVQHEPESLSTGIGDVDALIEGCPRGRITEIAGPVSSGRTTLLHSILAEASRLGEFCALVDSSNSFDPHSAAAAGVNLKRLVWIRCGGNADHAMRAADLLIHGGGFGVVAMDLCEVTPQMLRRIPLSYWYRFRRAIETTPCAFVLLSREPQAKACASVLIEMKRDRADFTGTSPLLKNAEFMVIPRKPIHPRTARFKAVS